MDKGKNKAVLETGYRPGRPMSSNHQWTSANWPKEYDNEHSPDDEDINDEKTNGCDPGELLINYKCDSSTGPMGVVKNRKRKKMRELESVHDDIAADHPTLTPPPPSPPHGNRYKCNSCNRGFPTHQALGGHRSSHNRTKNSHNACEEYPDAAADHEHSANLIPQDEEITITHQCKVCKMIFPSGQALGGHMRRHWMGQVEAPSPSQGMSPEEASGTGRVVLEIDLNEPAVVDDDNVEYQQYPASSGYPSSSNNSVG